MFKKINLIIAVCMSSQNLYAQSFEVMDLTGNILGEPAVSADVARRDWNRVCADWKKETKEMNRHSELLGINCNMPTCSYGHDGKTQCSSMGTYQIKTAGTRTDVTPTVVTAPPPQMITVQQQPQIVTVQETSPAATIVSGAAIGLGLIWMASSLDRGHSHHHHYRPRSWHHSHWRH